MYSIAKAKYDVANRMCNIDYRTTGYNQGSILQ